MLWTSWHAVEMEAATRADGRDAYVLVLALRALP
jgi:hypothetical protein